MQTKQRQGEVEGDEAVNNGECHSQGRHSLVRLLLNEKLERKNQVPSPTNLRTKMCFYLITDTQLRAQSGNCGRFQGNGAPSLKYSLMSDVEYKNSPREKVILIEIHAS
jgi:hypothetical protein